MPEPADAHLPLGREPGPQSLRAAANGGGTGILLPVMAILFLACFIGMPARRTEEEQRFRFRIPSEGPYSYEGECLSFAWRVTAREAGGPGDDSRIDDPFWVLP